MEPPPERHHPSLADRVNGRAKVVTFYKSGDRNFRGIQVPIRKKYNFGTLLSDLDRVSNFPFGVRRIVTPSATHDVTDLNDFEDGKVYIMAPTKKKPKPLDLSGLQARPPWTHTYSSPGSGANGAESEQLSPRRSHGNYASDSPRSSESTLRTVKKIMLMRNGDPHTKHMILLNRNKIPSFESLLTDIGESFQLPAQKLFSSDGFKVESLSAIFNGSEDLFVVGTGVEKFRPGSYKENSPFKSSSRQRESLRRKSMDETDQDQPPQKVIKKSRGKFRVWVATSENPAAGTDAVVSLTVYGDKGKSDDIVLGCGDGRFESGNEDEFNVSVGNIGEIYKIRIGHDDSIEFAGWMCEKVRLQDVHTGAEIVFPCGRWLSREEDDGQTCRELPVIADGVPAFPILNYYVAVVTGNYWNAGTSADVFMTVYGERGDTGPRLLHKTKRGKRFGKGKTNVFSIEAVSLGMLKKILIGHDSTEPDGGWFLERVIIKDSKRSSLESVFPCHCWLDATLDDDSKTSREICVNNKSTNLEKEMWEQDKWKFQPGNQVVFISKGSGKAIQIKADGSTEATIDPYTSQKTAVFEVHKVKGNVHIISSVANPDYYIAMDSNKISGKGKGNELKLRVQPDRSVVMETAKNSQLLTFGQTGKPGDVRGHSLGPTRQFYCYVKGVFRDEGIVMFYTSRIQTLTVTSDRACRATGQRSEDAYWRVCKVGDSGSVRMFESLAQPDSYLMIKDGHCDVQGAGDSFCHFSVLRVKDKGFISLQSVASNDVFVGFVSDGTVKPTIDTGEDNVRLYPEVIQFGIKKHLVTPTPPTSVKPAVNRKKRVVTKQPSSNATKAASLPRTPTPTPSPPVRERSIYDENKLLEYPSTPTPTPTPSLDEGGHGEFEDSCTPIPIPTPTPSPDEGLCDEFFADGEWKVWVKTGKVATKASVVLVVYGDDGASQPFTLGKGGKELFKAGEENEFKVNVLSIGDIYKIRIGLGTASKKATWRLDQVKMKDMITDEQLVFKFKNRWLSPSEDDADVWRESPAIRPGSKPLQMHKYAIQVTTGSEVGSSTDANVYLCLYGEKGDTGKRRLLKSNRQDKFQESQMDVFELEAVTVMTPTKVIVGHDGKGSGAGWFLREVVIKESKASKTEYVFPCNKWLDDGQDDKLIERELELTEVREIQPHEWQVYITTGSDGSAGTTAMVTLVAYGDNDTTEVALIPKEESGFQPGTTEDFRVYLGDIGQLYKIRIGHDNVATDASWYLKTVRMVDLNDNIEVQFEFDRWLSEKHDDLDVWRELPAVVSGKKTLPVTRYHIQVYTGSRADSSTEANVYLQLTGKNGDSGKRHLVRSKNHKDKKFRAGQMDIFEIEAVYLGRLQKVIVGHDGKEAGQGWYLEKVIVKESKNAKNEMFFPCKKWLDAGHDDQKIERELVPAKPSSTPNPVTSESAACKPNSITVSWKQPTSRGVTGYQVTCDPPDSPASEVIITDAKTTKAEFGGLTAGKAYQFDIVAMHGELESEKVTLKVNAKPNPAVDVCLESTAGTITVSWSNPEGEQSGYKLRISPSDAKKSVLKIKDPSKTRATFTGLTPSKKYKVDVITVCGEVESEKVTVQETTKMPEIHVLKVSSAETTEATSESLAVSWTKPDGDVNGYRLTILPAEGATPEVKIDGADKTTAEFKGLSSGQEYMVEVYTVYDDQESEKMTLTARTESQSNQPKDPAATSTLTTIDVSWTKPEGTVTGYRVLCIPADAETTEIKIDDGDTTKTRFEGLTPGRQYSLEIYALNAELESDKTTFTQTTKPNAVVDPVNESVSSDTINLAWSRPEGDLTGYRIDYQLVNNTASNNQSDDHQGEATTEADQPDQDQEKPFDDPGKPVDDPGKSDDGQDKSDDGQDKPADGQDTPVDGQDEPADGQAELGDDQDKLDNDQDKLDNDQDKPVDSQDTEIRTLSVDSADATKAEVTGLTPGQSYKFNIFAMSGEEESQEVTINCTTMPGKIVDIQVLTSAEAITFTWSPPAGTLTGYRVNCVPLSEEMEEPSEQPGVVVASNGYTKTLDLSCREISIEGVDPGSEYKVELWALLGEMEGQSVVLTAKTRLLDKPLPVLDPQTNGTTDTVTVRWTSPDCQYSGFRVVCSLKAPDSQNAMGVAGDKPTDEKPDESEREDPAIGDPATGDRVNKKSLGDETAPSSDESAPGDHGNEKSPRDEAVPSSDEKSPADSDPAVEDSRLVIEEKEVEADVTEVEFTGLDPMTDYSFDIYTVCDEVESEAVTIEEKTKKIQLPTQGEWKVWIVTAEDSVPSDNARVHMVVYGDRGKTEPIWLAEEDQHAYFQAANTDEFDINVGEIGDLYKIRIGHDGDTDWQGWHLTQVKMIDQHTDEELVFDFNRWMSRQEDDFDVVRELPAVREDQDTLPVNVYHVCVSTGDHWAAYTDANLWIILHGERGDTGKRILYHSLNHPDKYIKGQMDEFKMEAVSLGEVSMVEIGHDGEGYGAGIFINSVSVRESGTTDKEYLFSCNSWLDDHMEDRRTSRQLQLLGIRPIATEGKDKPPTPDTSDTNWKVLVGTSDCEDAGTTANVYLTVFGESGRSQCHVLQGKTLEPDSEQEFDVEIGEIGEITKIRLEHDDSGDSPAWHVRHVRLVNESKPELVFRVNAWLSTDRGDDPCTIREIAAIRAGADLLPVVSYTVQVHIKEDPDSASTQPDLHIALVGDAGEMAKRELPRTAEPVSQDGHVKIDTFQFEAVSVGSLQRAILSISSSEQQDTWFVEKVSVQEGRFSTVRSVFPCKMWFGNAIIGEDGDTVLQTDLRLEGEEAVPKDNKDDEDDGESTSKGNWTIWVTPGKEDGMGSNSNLSVQVYGEKGSSGVIPLRPREEDREGEGEEEEEKKDEEKKGEEKDEKEGEEKDEKEGDQGKEDEKEEKEKSGDETGETAKEVAGIDEPVTAEETRDGSQGMTYPPGCVKDFDIVVGEIGPIYKILLILDTDDDQNDTPKIFLDKVKMKDKDTNQEFHFFVRRWLRRADDILTPTHDDASPTKQEPKQNQEDKKDMENKKDEEEKKDEKPAEKKLDAKKKASKTGKTKDKKAEKGKTESKKTKAKMDETNNKKAATGEEVDETNKKGAPGEAVDETNKRNKEEVTGEDGRDEKKDQTQEDEVGDCYLELPAIRPDVPPLPVYQYELSVLTGDRGASSLSGFIYATVYGHRGDTGHRILRRSNNQVMFKQAQVDVFTIEAVDILRPSSITIGHQSEGLGAGWFLDKVTLKQASQSTTQYVFPCKRWMDTGVDDRELERNLPLLGELECPSPVTSDTKGHWQVKVKTSDRPDGGTSAKACLTVYGEKGKCSRRPLEREAFQPGTEQEFETSVDDIGEISKVRLEHDNTGDSPSWHVSTVTMKDIDTNEELEFKIDRWLARDQDDGQICYEVPAIREEKDSLPSMIIPAVYKYSMVRGEVVQITGPEALADDYLPSRSGGRKSKSASTERQVKVHTGDNGKASTEGAIHVTLHGTAGDSGQRLLRTSNNARKFAKGQVDVFIVQAVDLGKLHSISVRNTSQEPAQAWYLDKVIVKTSPKAEQEFIFPSSQWIGEADAGDDELMTAENDVKLLLQEKLTCTVHTSDIPQCGTDADVSLVAYGNNGMSKVMALTNGQEGNFQPGKSAEFELEPGAYVGDIYKIRVELQDGQDKSWHLKQVDLRDCFSDERLTFEYNEWLSRSQNDGKGDIVAEIPTLRPNQEPLPVVRYNLQVLTGEVEDAGTDSEVSITLFGEAGDTGRRLLSIPRDGDKAFEEPRKKDVFDIEAVSVGSISRVQIHKAAGTPWYLDRLVVKEGEFTAKETEFRHDSWLGEKDRPDQPVDIELTPTEERPSNTVAALPDGQEPLQSKGIWKVYIATGDTETAGIEANVTMTVYGSEGTSEPLALGQDDQPTKMEPGKTQEFDVNVGEVGQIYKVRLEHDGKGEQSAWFLEKIKMKDVDTKAEFSYTVSRWLSRDEEGCDRAVEIPAIWPETPIPPVVKYDIQVLTADEDDADTQANVYLTLKGEYGDTGRRDMVRPPGDTAMFSRGHTDAFTVEAVSLGKIDKCIVGHDGSQPDAGWFLDKIVVSVSGENVEDIIFQCNRWLAVDRGDNATEVELDALLPSEGAVDASPNTVGDDEAKDGGARDDDKDGENKEKGKKTGDGEDEDQKDEK